MITQAYPDKVFGYKTTPFDHQADTFLKSRDMRAYALFWEMGCGKSKPIIDTAAYLFLKGEIDGLLIVSDNGAYRNWVDYEIPIHMPDNIRYRAAYYASSMNKKEEYRSRQLLVAQDDVLDILVMNVEGFSSKKAPIFAEAFLTAHYSMMAVDESTSIKTPTSNRTIEVIRLGRFAEYRRILTGTPVTNGPLDLFSQFQFLADGLLGHTSFVTFRNQYAKLMLMNTGRQRYYKIVGYQNVDQLYKIMDPHTSRLTKAECLDLPEKIYETIYVDHTPEQRRAYDDLRSIALLQHDQGMVTVTSALTLLGKLMQINCGHVKTDDGVTLDIPHGRIQGLMDLIDKLDGKILIWAAFRRDIENICAALNEKYGKWSYVHYWGDTTDEERPEHIRRFRTDPTCRFFVSNPATGGKGITLVEAHSAIYYSNSFSPEKRWQSEDRNHRPGQVEKCTYFDMCVPSTVDVKVLKALKAKKDLASQVLDEFRSMLVDDLSY